MQDTTDHAQFDALALRLLKRGAPKHQLAFRLGLDMDEFRNLVVSEALFELARSGRHTAATIFWLKSAVASAKESPQNEPQYPDPPIIRAIDKDGNLYG